MNYFPFNKKLHAAVDLAARVHEAQYRKEPDLRTPYVAHVFGVSLILAQHGFSEEVLIAGLLHDVLEDQPGERAAVESFGLRVVELVEWVTEAKCDKGGNKRPWATRKRAYMERMRSAPPEARAISAADKIHNLQSTLMVILRGHEPWSLLSGSREQQLEHHRALLGVLREGWNHAILDHYASVLVELEMSMPAAGCVPNLPGDQPWKEYR